MSGTYTYEVIQGETITWLFKLDWQTTLTSSQTATMKVVRQLGDASPAVASKSLDKNSDSTGFVGLLTAAETAAITTLGAYYVILEVADSNASPVVAKEIQRSLLVKKAG